MNNSLQPVSAADVGLSADDAEQVVGFSVPVDSRRAALKVQAGELLSELADLPATIAIIVFLDDTATATDVSIQRMVKNFRNLEVDALIPPIPATEAVKRIQNGFVVESINRATLNLLRTPEIVDRRALEQALVNVDGSQLVNPTELVASSGGIVVVDS